MGYSYLRCLEYKRLGCLARAVIPCAGTVEDLHLRKGHNHPPDPVAEEKILFMRELKDVLVKSADSSPKDVYNLLSPM